jgi:hypothetical protein
MPLAQAFHRQFVLIANHSVNHDDWTSGTSRLRLSVLAPVSVTGDRGSWTTTSQLSDLSEVPVGNFMVSNSKKQL